MKKLLISLILFSLTVSCFTGCIDDNSDNCDADDDIGGSSGKLSVISTVFPAYDFAKQICGDNADVARLLPPGSESHSYEPSAQDIIKIQNCDLFIYVGGESDVWADKILDSMDTPVNTLKMMDCVNLVEEEIVAGMQDEEHDEEGEEHEEGGEPEYDEHVWTSPKNAGKIAEAISEAICAIDGENSEVYQENTAAYVAKLNQLDKDFTDFFAAVENKFLIFGDRFPFRYFADDYGIEYSAAFPGCSTETEASAQTIKNLIDIVKAENISTVFYIEFSNHIIADSIAEATDTKTALLHSCHNVSKADLESGATYISLMEQNLAVLKEALK